MMEWNRTILPAMAVAGASAIAATIASSSEPEPFVDQSHAAATSSVLNLAAFDQSASAAAASETTTDWVRISDGKLIYKTTPNGDQIMDFSTAGYAGGGVALPAGIPTAILLSPSGGDDTAAIQKAVDDLSARSRPRRYRGVIQLNSGKYRISQTITINAAGIILAGSGSGNDGTVIEMTGDTGFLAFKIGSSDEPIYSNDVDLTSSYIKSGSKSVRVSSVAGFRVGQRVAVRRKVTSEWITHIGMDQLVRDGQPQTWMAAGTTIDTPRAISDINPNTGTITFDAPMTDSFDSTYLGSPVGTLSAVANPGQIGWVGIEHLQIKAPAGTTVYSAVRMNNVINGYLSDIVGQETQDAFTVGADALQITLEKVINNNSTAQTAGAPKADFAVTGSQVLLNKCRSSANGTWAFVTGAKGVGPTVLLKFSTTNSVGIGPHQRWYTGLLIDNALLPNATTSRPGIALTNRSTAGSGHGWTTAWSVAWNVTSPYFKVQAAPGTANWCIGCIGQNVSPPPVGTFDVANSFVTPASLYLEQLKERKGIAAVNAIGYLSTTP